MSGIESRPFDSPNETRTPPKTRIDVVLLGDTEVGRFRFEPGWKWSECIKPVVGTQSCQAEHIGYMGSGRLTIVLDNGTSTDLVAGDAYRIPPGHDAWVVGDEPVTAYEFKSAGDYARG